MFSGARSAAQRLKLNKASLLSWILFYCRFESSLPKSDFLAFFEEAKTLRRDEKSLISAHRLLHSYQPTAFERDLFALFVDRSSLRVSDVSSVVYRDFAIWAIYVKNKYGSVPESISIHQIDRIADLLHERSDVSMEYALDGALNIQVWARF